MPSQEIADRIFKRIVALDRMPLPKDFSLETLRTIHGFIFHDGKDEFHPGKYRDPVMQGHDWVKYRRLETIPLEPAALYSHRDESAMADAEDALHHASESLAKAGSKEEAAEILAKLYAELDFLHPFHDGNSRSIRSFTRLLARAHGWHIAWEEISPTAAGRDRLYVARDEAVDTLALSRLEISEESIRNEIGWFQEEAASYESLNGILAGLIRPLPGQVQEVAPTEKASSGLGL